MWGKSGKIDAPAPKSADEALFEALGKGRRARRRRVIRTVVIVLCLLALGVTGGVVYLRGRVREQFAPSAQEVLSAQAELGSVSTLVSGSGLLSNVDTETVSVPDGVEVTELLVTYGDTVQEGALLASVDMASVRTAMAELQTELEELDAQIADARGETVSSSVTAGVPGRVKLLYAQRGDSVEDAMVASGALAELSLDGYLAAQIATDAVREGDKVLVVLPDGTELTGSVETAGNGAATVLVTDNGPACGADVTVRAESGETLGTGTLFIHSPLKVTGYAGTVSWVNVSLNQQVYAATVLFTLTDTSTSADYDALLRSRGEKEQTLLELLRIQKSGGLTAPISGSVCYAAELSGDTAALELVTLSPDVSMSVTVSVDELDILALEPGQTALVTVKSIGEEQLAGVVTQIDKTDSSGAYTAVITLDKVSGMLPGMTASVDVRIEGVDDAVVIPAEALHQSGSGYYVYTAYDEQTQELGGRTEVVPGLSNSSLVEIRSGLSQGQTVYYTQEQTFANPFDFGGGEMPNFGGGNGDGGNGGMPNFGGNSGGMPDFGGGRDFGGRGQGGGGQ